MDDFICATLKRQLKYLIIKGILNIFQKRREKMKIIYRNVDAKKITEQDKEQIQNRICKINEKIGLNNASTVANQILFVFFVLEAEIGYVEVSDEEIIKKLKKNITLTEMTRGVIIDRIKLLCEKNILEFDKELKLYRLNYGYLNYLDTKK